MCIVTLDLYGHHAFKCKQRGGVVGLLLKPDGKHARSIRVEVGHNLLPDHSRSHPADILLPSWNFSKPALDVAVASLPTH